MGNIIVTILSFLLSGILATLITIFYQNYADEKAAKRKIFETAVSSRYCIVEEENVKALNSIDVIFHNNKNVRQSWKAFIDEADKQPPNPQNINDKYMKLLEEMAIVCGYKNIKWDDLRRHYYPTGLSRQKVDEETLRNLQIKSAEKSLSSSQQNTTKEKQLTDQLVMQLLPKLIENPESFNNLLEFAEKSKK